MECPFCKEEMQQGHISVLRELLCFYPQKSNITMFRSQLFLPKNVIRIGTFDFWKGNLAKANYCPKCQKVIVDVK